MKPTVPVFDTSWRVRSQVKPVGREVVDWMIKNHYIHKWPGVVVAIHALFVDDIALGVVVYALPPRETEKRYGKITWELARLWIDDSLPQNTASFLISRSIRILRANNRPALLVSYADPSVGHEGTVYRACNWLADGRTDDDRKTPRFDYVCAVTDRHFSRKGHVPNGTVLIRKPRVSKPRFIYTVQP